MAALCPFLFVSCGESAKVQETVSGVVLDASMNSILVVTAAGDTVSISTMDTDPAKVPAVMISDSVKVFVSNVNFDGVEVLTADSLAITAHSPYFYIQGTWTEANPINAQERQGFVLNQDGSAVSVNMATLQFKNWNLTQTNELIMQSESIGNKQTIVGNDTMNVVKLNADSLVLAKGANVMFRLARTK